MGWSRSTALVALIAISSAIGIISTSVACAEEAVISQPVKIKSSVKKPKHQSRFGLGISTWSEHTQIIRKSDNRSYDVDSSLWSLALGYQWHRISPSLWGIVLEAQGLYGKNASESRDSQLVYYKNNDPVYGADIGVGGYKILAQPNVSVGLGINFLWRNVRYTEPDGYSFSAVKQKLHYATKLSFAWPLTDQVDLVQQFSIFLGEPGSFWLLGIRM